MNNRGRQVYTRRPRYALQRLNVGRLRALRALGDGELHPLVLVQGTEPTAADGGEAGEHVSAAVIGRDEAEALVRVEPLNRTGRRRHVFTPKWELLRTAQRGPCRCADQRDRESNRLGH